MRNETEKKPLVFELDEDMLSMIAEEFSPEGTAKKFLQAIGNTESEEIERIGVEFFQEYGRNLMRRSLQLGEEFPDRTYEVLREAADQTGSLTFPLIPQRFIEIAFLSIQKLVFLPVIENNARRFIFLIEDCLLYDQIKVQSGKDVAEMLHCRHGCLAACREAFSGFGVDQESLSFKMNATTDKEGYCEFVVRRGSGAWD